LGRLNGRGFIILSSKKNKKIFKKLLTNPKEYDIINTTDKERGK
jgi:hypothetical protein